MRRVILVALAVSACSTGKGPPRENAGSPASALTLGESRLAVPGGSIWYKVSGTGRGTPVVLLHGGPGFSSVYLKPFEDLGPDRGVVRYDQLGGGQSDKITDTTMFNIPHFVAELDSLRSHLGLTRWHVLGHSWGTMLALEYYKAYPDRVASLTFGSAVFDVPAYEEHSHLLLRTLSRKLQNDILMAEQGHEFADSSYHAALDKFYALYVWRHPVAAELDSMFATANQAIYNYMQGPSEFTITGTLKSYNQRAALPAIRVPTLFTVGEFDEVGPELVRSFAAAVPGARVVQFAGAAHMTPWDARDENVRVVREFLRSADSSTVVNH